MQRCPDHPDYDGECFPDKNNCLTCIKIHIEYQISIGNTFGLVTWYTLQEITNILISHIQSLENQLKNEGRIN